jgi:hypothetical protein
LKSSPSLSSTKPAFRQPIWQQKQQRVFPPDSTGSKWSPSRVVLDAHLPWFPGAGEKMEGTDRAGDGCGAKKTTGSLARAGFIICPPDDLKCS